MGKFTKLKKVDEENKEETPMEWQNEDTTSSEESENEDNTEEMQKRAELWTNRERVLMLCSRGADVRTRYLMNDLKEILPHSKGDSKLDQQKSLNVLNEIAEMKNCSKVIYFESRKKKDTYLWMSNVDQGPSIKFLVHNVHTMKELKLSGNCLKASRPILSFDDSFDKKPQLKLVKEMLLQTLGTPHHHPRSQPFVDHIFQFSVGEGDRIWFRNFQIVDESLQLQEIGPRFVLEMSRVFSGSFEGAVLYDNPNYVSPNFIRRQEKMKLKASYLQKQIHDKSINIKNEKISKILSEKMEDPVGKEFDSLSNQNNEQVTKVLSLIDKKKKKKVKKQGKKYVPENA